MRELNVTARCKNSSEEYSSLLSNHLHADIHMLSGTGMPDEPSIQQITITANEDFEGVIRIAMPINGNNPRYYLPGFMYGTNRGEAPLLVDSKCPRLRMEEAFPASSWWMVRSDRLSHPCAFAYGQNRLTGFTASPYFVCENDTRNFWEPGVEGEFEQYTGFGCSLETNEVWYTIGYENAPWMFVDSHNYTPRAALDKNCFTLKQGESISFILYCFDYPAEDERALHHALKWVYNKYHQAPRRLCSIRETVHDIATAIARDAWLPDRHMYTCFVFDKGDHFEYRPLPSIAWTNGLASAVPMLTAALRLKDENMRMQALDCIDHIVLTSINEQSGLPYMAENDGIWSNRGWWYDKQNVPGHTAYLIGQCVYLTLRAYAWEKREHNILHEDWLNFAKKIIAVTEKSRNCLGEYPYMLSDKTGVGLEFDSFSGAWCLAAAAYYTYLTEDKTYLPMLLQSAEYYHTT